MHLPNPPLPPSAVSAAPLWFTVLPHSETYKGRLPHHTWNSEVGSPCFSVTQSTAVTPAQVE